MKKLLIGIIVLVLCVLVGYGVYNSHASSKEIKEDVSENKEVETIQINTTPEKDESENSITKVTDEGIEIKTEKSEKTKVEKESNVSSTEETKVEDTKSSKEKEEIKEEKVQEEKKEVKPKYTDEELYIMSHLIMGEASGASWEHKLGVGSVALNRVKSSKFPNTLKGVVFQKGQYACTWDGNYDKTPNEESIKAAKYLLENGSQMPDNVVFQAEFKQGKGVYKKIGNTYFCYY